MKTTSIILVTLQFAGISAILFTGTILLSGLIPIFILSVAILIVIWAFLAMRRSRISVFPDLLPGSKLIDKGPYKYIRHPMYLSVLLGCLAFVVNEFSWLRLILFFMLIITLIVKIHYEEKILRIGFRHYKEYSEKTKKLIPFIY